jgi:hypothetical protein
MVEIFDVALTSLLPAVLRLPQPEAACDLLEGQHHDFESWIDWIHRTTLLLSGMDWGEMLTSNLVDLS